MSSFITSNKNKSRIAKLIYRELWCNGDQDGCRALYGDIIKTLQQQLENLTNKKLNIDNADVEILKVLEDINRTAVNKCYNENEPTIHHHLEFIKIEDAYSVETLKAIQCFIYQCAESGIDEKNENFLKSLEELVHYLALYLIEHTNEWNNAPWGD